MFGAFSYLAYTFTKVSGFSSGAVAWLLVLYGRGLVAGNVLGGRAADRHRDPTLIASLAGLAATWPRSACSTTAARPRPGSPS